MQKSQSRSAQFNDRYSGAPDNRAVQIDESRCHFW